MAAFITKGDNLFNEAIFQHNYKNVPIPSFASGNLKTYADAIGTNSILYTLLDYKAKKSSQIKPIIVKEVKDKLAAKEFYKWNGKFTEAYEIRQHNHLRTKAFEELPMDEIDSNSELFYLKKLLTNPNPNQTWSAFMYANSMFEDLAGWSLMYGERAKSAIHRGKFTELYQMPTHEMEIMGGTPMEPISGYRFKSFYRQIFEVENSIRNSTFSPLYDSKGGHLYGTSKVKVAWELFKVHSEAIAREYSSNSGGDLRAILMPESNETIAVPEGIGENKALSWLKDSITRAFRQMTSQRISVVGQPLKDIQFRNDLNPDVTINSKRDAKNDASAVWGLDSTVVFPTEKGTTYENQKDQIAKSLRNGVFPSLIRHEEIFREQIVKEQYPGYSLIYDYDVYEELTKDQTKEMETLEKVTFLSDNEKRTRIDYEPLEDERANNPRAYWDTLMPQDVTGEL